MSDKFAQPTEVSQLDMAFATNVSHLMPSYDEIREQYNPNRRLPSLRLFRDIFYRGIKSADGLVPREGIDKNKALRHIRTVMSSWEPKHEHKEAAVAFLFDKWFDMDASKWEVEERESA